MKKSHEGSSQKPKKSKIVVMTDHFLYLPLYYASSKNYFGFLPPGHSINIVPSIDRTDVSAFRMLMDVTSEENREIDFAVADPACILDSNSGTGPAPVILAELISNTAFWAIDRRTRPISFIKDIASFDRIIAFHPGTTSYGIASRIFRDAGKAEAIKRVQPGQELVALQDSKKGTIALSPDILGIDQLISNHSEYNIDLALGSTPEYNSVLLTGLMTRSDVAAQYPELARGLLKALQQSLLLIKQCTPDVVRYANDRFLGYGEDHVVRALYRTDECHVFPTTIEVSEAHWINAARVACDAKKGCRWDAAAQSEALRLYQQSILPYSHLAKSAVHEIYSRVATALETEPPKTSIIKELGVPLLWLAVSGVVTKWLHWSAPVALACAVLLGVSVARLAGFAFRSMGWFLHWLIVSATFVVFAGWQTFGWNRDLVLGIIATLVVGELSFIHSESKKK